MIPNNALKPIRTGLLGLAMGAAIYMGTVVSSTGEDTNAPVAVTAGTKADKALPEKKPKKTPLTGAELYSIHCNRCHAERYATEFTSTQWKTIMTHMRVRANLPAAQAREILKYLQEDSGN